MSLEEVSRRWSKLGDEDPLWAVLTTSGKDDNRWDVDEFLQTGAREIEDLMVDLEGRVVGLTRGTALDFGCGAGRLTQGLASAGFGHVTGVDLSAGMLAKARELNKMGDRCEFLLNTRSDLSVIADATIDLVYCSRVLQHMPPSLAHGYLAEFFRIVRPGGIVVFQIPSHPAPSLTGLTLRLTPRVVLNRLRRGMEMHGTREAEIRSIVAAAGANVLAVEADAAAGPRWVSRRYICQAGRP